jgi:hypothetical protein
MNGLGFIHPGFLAAGIAVAVPIVIHLLFRQQARRVDIGSIYFLRVALRDQAHRRKLRRWLLLALRAAGVLLLAALFARPYWRAPESPAQAGAVILLLDRSASMGAGREGKTPWDLARQKARKLIDDLPAGSTLHLASFDAGGITPMTPEALRAKGAVGPAATDYSPALDWARDLVLSSGRQRSKVYLFSDLQRAGIRRRPEGPFPETAAVTLVDVGRPLSGNLAVEDVQVEQADFRPGLPTTLAARIANTGLFAARDVGVTLSLDKRPPAHQTVRLEPHARRIVRFPITLGGPGLYHGSVAIGGEDDFAADDRRWLAFEARSPERILLVDGEPGRSIYAHETYYLETALALRTPGAEAFSGETSSGQSEPAGGRTPFETVRVDWPASPPDGAGSLPDLGGFRVVVLCNVAEVPEATARALADFVKVGGQLVIFSGDHVGRGAYASLRRSGIFPARVDELADPGVFRLTRWQQDHPIFRPFDQPEHGDLRTLRFDRICRLIPDQQGRELAVVEGNLPLLVESRVGSGRCVLLAVPADNQWGDWAIQRLYLPLIHQLMGYLTDRLPESARVRLEPADSGSGHAPGVVLDSGRAVVRNLDPAESDLERITPATFREAYRLPVPHTAQRPPDAELTGSLSGSQRPDEIWAWMVLVLLAVLVAETFVANRTYA